MMKNSIIVDLDYTIFQTNTIKKKSIEPFIKKLKTELNSTFSKQEIQNIEAELWTESWDFVIEKYQIPKEIFSKAIKILEKLPLNLLISTYPDYTFLKNFKIDKFLVTTGLTYLQNEKIKALNIQKDFTEIIINDRLIETKTKFDIFQELLQKYNLSPEKTYVIGDNPNSEIQAGNRLKLNTIQILRAGIKKGDNAKYYVTSFDELPKIIK